MFFSAAVLLVGWASGLVIPAPRVPNHEVYFSEADLPNVTLNDPRCIGNGIYPNPDDCTKYYSCKNGDSQSRDCPEGFKFDSDKHCTPSKEADCGEKTIQQLSTFLNEVECPEEDTNCEYLYDCHKYILCHSGKPEIMVCPMNEVYQINGGCVYGDFCPQQQQITNCRRRDEPSESSQNQTDINNELEIVNEEVGILQN